MPKPRVIVAEGARSRKLREIALYGKRLGHSMPGKAMTYRWTLVEFSGYALKKGRSPSNRALFAGK